MILAMDSVDVRLQSVPVLRGLSLAVGEGEIVGLVGRNGAGKTTTLRTMHHHGPHPATGRIGYF